MTQVKLTKKSTFGTCLFFTESHCSPPRLRKGKGESGSLLSAPGQSYGSMASNHGAASMAVTCSDVKEEEDRDKHEEEDYEFNETNERKS